MDAISLSFVSQELSQSIVPSQVRKIYETRSDELLLQLWAGRELWLLISLSTEQKRLHLVDGKESPSKTPSAFCMYLRKYVQGLLIRSLSQPDLERIMKIHLGTREKGITHTLIIELYGREGNIILLDGNDKIMRSLKSIPGARRSEVEKYVLPQKPSHKIDPFSVDNFETFSHIMKRLNGSPEVALSRAFFSLNGTYAREILYTADVSEEKPLESFTEEELSALFRSWMRFWLRIREKRIKPVIILDESGSPRNWGLWLYREFGGQLYREYETLNGLLKVFYHKRAQEETLAEKRDKIIEQAKAKILRLERRCRAMLGDLENAKKSLEGKEKGELILLNLNAIEKGMSAFEAENIFCDPPENLIITLESRLSPQENASNYFEKFKKAKRGIDILTVRLDETRKEIEKWGEFIENVEKMQDHAALDGLESFSREQAKGLPVQTPGGPRRFRYKSYDYMVGRNPRENDELTLKIAGPDDLWFHVRRMPGAHVVLRLESKKKEERIPEEILLRGAALAAYYSRGRKSSKIPVDCTRVRFVKKTRHMQPGMVTLSHERTYLVNPQDNEFQEWLKQQLPENA